MARNLKKDYIRKIMSLDAPNGYRFDIENYLYNPAYGNDFFVWRMVSKSVFHSEIVVGGGAH